MNGRRLIVLIGLLGLLVVGMPAVRVMAATPQLPAEVRTSTNSQVVHQPIQTFLAAQIAKLTNEDPTVQSQAREQIIAETSGGGTSKPSDPFLDAYSDVLANSLKGLEKNKDPRVRLNVAIIVAQVAKASNSPHLAALIIDMLKDPSEPVVLWAVKGAKYVLPTILGNAVARQNVPLLPEFLKAVNKYAKSAAIVQSAYESLKLETTGPNAVPVPPAMVSVILPQTVDAMLGILQMRIGQYQTGVPPQPGVDAIATGFIVLRSTWAQQPEAQKLQTTQDIFDLLSVISKRWSDATMNQKKDLADLFNLVRKAAWVVGDNTGSDKIKSSVSDTGVIASTTPAEIEQKVENLRAALKTVPAFAGLKPPPPVSAMNPTEPPSTQPTSATSSAPGT